MRSSVAIFAIAFAATPWLLSLSNPWIPYPSFNSLYNSWIGGQILVAALATAATLVIAYRWRDPPALEPILSKAQRQFGWMNIWWTAALMLVACWLIGGIVLLGILDFPISLDVVAYIKQAETFAGGMLTAPAPPAPEAFDLSRFTIVGDQWVSQYLPGWSLILAPFAWAGLPLWLVPGFFGAGSVILFWLLVRRRADQVASILAVLALCSSVFFLFNASTLWAHSCVAFFGLAAAEATSRRREGGSAFWALAAGLAIGAMGLARPFNAIIFLIILLPAIATAASSVSLTWRLRSLVMVGLGGLPFAFGVLLYQDAITGSPFTTIPTWLGRSEAVGEVTQSSLAWTVHRTAQLVLTTSPAILLAIFVCPLLLYRQRKLDFTDLLFPATLVAFLFYSGSGGAHEMYGPRYWYEGFPYLFITAAATLSVVGLAKPFVRAVVIVHFALQAGGLVGWMSLEHVVVKRWSAPYRVVERWDLNNAIVLFAKKPPSPRSFYSKTHLTRNPLPPFDDVPVLLATWSPENVESLQKAYPERELWLYRPFSQPRLAPLGDEGGQ